MISKESAHFKTNVLLKSIIGKDLINNDNIAVLELVKNSYDAHSPNVKVIFKNIKNNDDLSNPNYSNYSSKIIIKDEGVGMDEDDILNKWLNIAFSEKRYTKKENNRLFAGAKGVGRFSCDRLGYFLDIYTKKKGGSIIHLFIDWRAFEVENERDLEIQDIPLKMEEISDAELLEKTGYSIQIQGTILEISKLRSKWVSLEKRKKNMTWNSEKLLELRTYLAKLIHPNQSFTNDSFRIDLEVNEFLEEDKNASENEKINEKIENLIFEKLDFTTTLIETKLINNGESIETVLKDKDRVIFNLIEKNIDFPLLKNLDEVKITLYFLNQYSKVYFKKATGIRSVNYGSVFLFVNNFRISPIGDEGDDWLNLEVRRGQGRARYLGNRDILGQIVIQDTKNIFQIVSNRQGIDKNDSYKELIEVNTLGAGEKYKGLVFKTIRRLEKFVVDILDWDNPLTEQERTDNSALQNLMSEFEKKVNSPDWKFDATEEKYAVNQEIKDKKVIELIYNLINVKNENIVKLYINEELVKSTVEEKEQEAKALVDDVLRKLSNISFDRYDEVQEVIENAQLDLDKINTHISKIAFGLFNSEFVSDATESIESLKKQLNQIKQDLEEERLQRDKQAIELTKEKLEKEKTLSELEKERISRQIVQKELDSEKQKRESAENETKQKKSELEVEKKKNNYLLLQRRFNDDTEGILHHISIWSGKSKSKIDKLIKELRQQGSLTENIKTEITELRLFVEKTSTMANLITRAGFKKDEDKQVINICEYLEQYLAIYHQIYTSELNKSIEAQFISNGFSVNKNISPFELSIIVDNLISNSQKWQAKKIVFEIVSFINNSLKMLVYDDGLGLSSKFVENPNQIFELGITESNGSGIGLHFIKNIMTKEDSINGDIIFIGNNLKLKGACFELTFN